MYAECSTVDSMQFLTLRMPSRHAISMISTADQMCRIVSKHVATFSHILPHIHFKFAFSFSKHIYYILYYYICNTPACLNSMAHTIENIVQKVNWIMRSSYMLIAGSHGVRQLSFGSANIKGCSMKGTKRNHRRSSRLRLGPGRMSPIAKYLRSLAE